MLPLITKRCKDSNSDFSLLNFEIMKKFTTWLVAIVLPATMILTLISCQKDIKDISPTNSELVTGKSHEPVTRAYRDSFEAELNYIPDFNGGYVQTNPYSHVWWPGSGDGNATHMGNVSAYFNQYTIRTSGIIYMFHSPATMFFPTELQAFNVPQNVSLVVVDGKGNSVWFRNSPEGFPSTPVSPTKIIFNGTMIIAGGSGKFSGATGETSFHGFFNPQNLQECSFWQNGWIQY